MAGWIVTEAQVRAREGDAALVAIKPHSPCGNCDPQTGCRALALSRAFARPDRLFRVEGAALCRIGQAVEVAIPEGTLWRAGWQAYGLPTLALIAGAAIGEYLAPAAWQPWAAVGGAVLSMLLASLTWRRPPASFPRVLPAASTDDDAAR